MATITNAVTAATLGTASNIREDLGNVIYNVSPFLTPFTSNIAVTAATNDNHEWLTDTYSAAETTNANVEAPATVTGSVDSRVRKGNNLQIAQKSVVVTQKAEILDRAGVPGKEMAYQLMKLGKELQMDIEAQLLCIFTTGTTKNVKAAGTSSANGKAAGVPSWINTNEQLSAGTANTASDGTTGPAPGTSAAMTTARMNALIDGVWSNSGDFSSAKLMGSAGVISAMRDNAAVGQGMSTSVDTDASNGEIINRVAVYVSQFGPIAVVPNKHMPADTLYLLDYSTWGLAVAGGKKIHSTEVSTGTSAKQTLLQSYYTLEARSEEANGAYYAINA